ncbi:MAG: SOS response-associated peptidase [Candidatus Cyclobacteriaceae bacterium M3_2C_046]
MCGRYTVQIDMVELHRRFKVVLDDIYQKSYNSAPSEKLPVITNQDPNQLNYFHWGLVPFWAKDKKIGYKMINARAETILEKSSYKHALQRRRCLVVADGFYEWKKLDNHQKQPYRITLQDEEPYAFAGIWEYNQDLQLHSFSIITTEANELVKDIHDRMPVILKPENETRWLDHNLDLQEIQDFLIPYPADLMKAYQVSRAVGNAHNKSPDLIKRVA